MPPSTDVSWIIIDYIGFSLSVSINNKIIDSNRLKMDYNITIL